MSVSTGLSNLQQELLKVFSRNLNEKELEEVRDLLVKYFADKAIESADKTWEERGYTNGDMDKWLNDSDQ